ncbi:ankyrin repeat-containing domain protein [Aspergillus leporis]|uniref:Ankyrin repeat-containing domain protein n=1 Tax=Aspergillus leporis TaxID=41062 RepID=A0A5N5WM12_9EURO|nr:ankyrin repeat-containing domain protein [Aspergillus leporis]
MKLNQLPQELLLQIAEDLQSQQDINILCQVSRDLYHILNRQLYLYNIRYHNSNLLQWAALHGSVGVVQTALNYNADVNTTAPISGTKLPNRFASQFCRDLRFELQRDLSNKAGGPLQFSLARGAAPPLALAAGAGYKDVARCLLQNGATADRTGVTGMTPLMMAAQGGHTDVVELLLQNGADFSLRRHGQSRTALELAAEQGHASVLEILLQYGADPNQPSADPALTIAADKGHVHVVQMLLDYGANIQVKSSSGMTALINATDGDHVDVVRLLLQRGQDLESDDFQGVTLLMHAVRLGAVKVSKLLLHLGAEVNGTDENSRTPLWWAVDRRDMDIIHMLIENGAHRAPEDSA